uniref:Putative radical SAM superfamily protein n=1 Tax=viral metagenome TaxID=1070528 RepID=A0A6M3KIN2_9ZZZZ
MNIAFINPTLGGDYSAMDIAITVLATQVNELSRHNATIVDLTFHRRNWRRYLWRELRRAKTNVIGFSLNNLYMQYTREIAQEIKKHTDIPIIVGGHYACCEPLALFNEPWVDAVATGDAEESLIGYLDMLQRPRESEVDGIWYRCKGRSYYGSQGQFRHNLDDLPVPDWNLWKDLSKHFYFLGGMLYVIGSRGCPYQCSFCLAPEIARNVPGHYFRMRDPVAYAQEIGELWHRHRWQGMRFAQLFDPVFTIYPDWVERFCDEYQRLGLHKELPFSVFSRCDHIDEQRVEALAAANCAILRVGVESGDDHMRNDIYGKSLGSGEVRQAVELCHRYGIRLTAFYILGGPGETHQSIQRTIDLARELDAARSAFFVFKPFTRKALQQVLDEGGEVLDEKWAEADNITFGVAVKPSPKLGPKQVAWYQRWAYFTTFGKRWLSSMRRLKWRYFWRLGKYLLRGWANGLSTSYLMTYGHIYEGDYVWQ